MGLKFVHKQIKYATLRKNQRVSFCTLEGLLFYTVSAAGYWLYYILNGPSWHIFYGQDEPKESAKDALRGELEEEWI